MCDTCKAIGLPRRAHFPGYPTLRRVTQSDHYGRMTLLSVSPTSDGFLLGHARIGTGRNAYIHSVLIGRASDHPPLEQFVRAHAVRTGRLSFQVMERA